MAARLSVALTTAQRAIDRLKSAGIVALAGEAKRNRVYCARALLEILEEPPQLAQARTRRGRRGSCCPHLAQTQDPKRRNVPSTSGITNGPDGNLWFTEFNANKIGRLTTAGSFTEYIIPTRNSGPQDLTTGPDGNVWFAEQGGQIGRLNLVTEARTGSDSCVIASAQRAGARKVLWLLLISTAFLWPRFRM